MGHDIGHVDIVATRSSGGETGPAAAVTHPLPPNLQGRFEQSVGIGLGGVRIDTTPDANRAADTMNARAFTVGQQIHFGAGEYEPASSAGQALLAHEIVHVAQQANAPVPDRRQEAPIALEAEATSLAPAVARGASVRVSPAPTIAAAAQPKGGTAVAAPPQQAPAISRNDAADLVNGFETLAATAVNQGARGLDSARFGTDLSPAHRTLLEQIRKVLILAQESEPDARQRAILEWPKLAAKLQAELDRSPIPSGTKASVADHIALVAEKYVRVPHRGPSQIENSADYADFVNGVTHLTNEIEKDWWDQSSGVIAANIKELNEKQRGLLAKVTFGANLADRHRVLLEKLRATLILARTEGSSREALQHWNAIQGELAHAFKGATELIGEDLTTRQERLARIGQLLIHGGVYAEAHQQALEKSGLQAPDLAFDVESFKEAARGLKEAQKLAEKGLQLTGQNAIDYVLNQGKLDKDVMHAFHHGEAEAPAKLGGPIFEIAKYPGEVHKLLEEYKKKGLIGKSITVAELAHKTEGMAQAIAEVSCNVVKRYAEKQVEIATRTGTKAALEVAEKWEKVGKWATKRLELLEKVGKVALVVSIIISAVKVVDALRQGKWGEALEEAGETVLGLAAGAAGGAAGSATVGGIGIIIAAEAEALSGAAAMIHWAKKTSAREAAFRFVDLCDDAAKIEARDFVADVMLLSEHSVPSEKDQIEQKLASAAVWWGRHVKRLNAELAEDRTTRMGGQPALRAALGVEVIAVLQGPVATDWQVLAQQIRIVFAGANRLAAYVVENFPKKDKEDEGEGEDGEE